MTLPIEVTRRIVILRELSEHWGFLQQEGSYTAAEEAESMTAVAERKLEETIEAAIRDARTAALGWAWDEDRPGGTKIDRDAFVAEGLAALETE